MHYHFLIGYTLLYVVLLVAGLLIFSSLIGKR
jgi:hypothetical protein